MTHQITLYIGLALSLICVGAGGVFLQLASRSDRATKRLRSLGRRGIARPADDPGDISVVRRSLAKVGRYILSSGLLSRATITDLEETIAASSSSAGHKLAFFVGAKFVLLIGLPLAVWVLIGVTGFHAIPAPLVILGFAIVGLLAPDWVIRRNRRKYVTAVDAGMPAGLDLLIMCAEAGLSLEGGLERVAVDGKAAAPETANEFRITANEMKILSDRRQALINMGVRTKLDSTMRLGGALAQSLKYGTPLIQALRVLAAEMRQAELTRFEEKAARIPVLLTIPMILFILPCIFVVVGGPAAIRVAQTFMHR